MKLKLLILPMLLSGLAACDQMQSAQEPATEAKAKAATAVESGATLATDEDRFSYGLGMMIGERVLKQYGEVDYEKLLAGMKAQHQNEETLLTLPEAETALNTHLQKQVAAQSEVNRKRGEDYLEQNKSAEGVQVSESGLQYNIISEGDGAKPLATDRVKVHYRGTLIDGTEFDSSYARGEPASFALNQVIPGWTEGLQLMSVGSKFRFVIPYNLGYGERGAGGSIGPFETLIFEVELLDIES